MRRPNRSRYERRRSLFQVQRIISESCEDGSAETFLTLVGKRWTRRLDVNRCELDVNHISPPVSLLPANPFIMFIPMFIQKPWNAVKCRVLYLGNQTLCVCVLYHTLLSGRSPRLLWTAAVRSALRPNIQRSTAVSAVALWMAEAVEAKKVMCNMYTLSTNL